MPTILGVPTSVAAFLGYFRRGPINTPMQVFGPGDLEREFGGLHPLDEAGYAIEQFFLNGGSTAWVVRVAASAGTDLTAAAVTLQADDGTDVLEVVAGRRFGGEIAQDPGAWGDALRIDVDYDTRVPGDTHLFNLAVSEVGSQDGRRVVLRREEHAGLSIDGNSPDYAVERVNRSSTLIQLVAAGGAATPPARPAQTGTTGGPVDRDAALDATSTLGVNAGTGDRVVVLDSLPGATTFGAETAAVRQALEHGIRAAGTAAGDAVLAGARVTVQDGALRVLGGADDRVDLDPETVISFTDSGGSTAADLGLDGTSAAENVQQYVVGTTTDAGFQSHGLAGADGDLPDADALLGDVDGKQGIYALRDVDVFNILVLPGAVAGHMSGDDAASVYAAAETFCEAERAFLIVDVPEGIDGAQEVRDWVEDRSIRHRNAAVYFPRVRIPDRLDDRRLRSVGAGGTMAGVYARTDAERGVWKAPAGSEAVLRNVQDLAVHLTDAENGRLNPVAINTLRHFPIYGPVAWGARTLDGADARASEWKYVPVRRLALHLEESLYRGLQWAVFEPNDESLWSRIRLSVGAFMHELFRRGAFQGTSPRDACFIKCDAQTTTMDDIDQGIVNVLVGFAPLEPAEFVIIKIQQKAGRLQI